MANYFVGDIQGCYLELRKLLEQVNFDPATDILWPAGDLVARGEDSLATLEFLIELGDSARPVLGNHDLHLIATHYGIKKPKAADKLAAIFNAPHREDLIEWLVHQPLLSKLPNEEVYMSHAGLSPQWTIEEAFDCARFVEKKLQGKKRESWLAKMYGEKPNDWRKVTTKEEKFRFTVNALTRMRYVYQDGRLEFSCKLGPKYAPDNLMPWFSHKKLSLENQHWIFGHWAALEGEVNNPHVYGLDTGCVWGGELTLLCWETQEIHQVSSLQNGK